ncbi:MAG: tetratricopeptide repeat protein [Chloroflexi bacterium]|nr:tetratricopeptide repeat protein [Chloroflexota bacterium]
MNLSPRRPIFNRRPENNIYRIFVYLTVILAGLWIYYGVSRGTIKPAGEPLPTPTRAAQSYSAEGDAHFTSGDLGAAITSYRKALELDPNNAGIWATLARIQTYNSSLKTTDADRRTSLTEALTSIDQAKTLAPDDSTVAATRAFVLDWNATPSISGERAAGLLVEAEQEAVRALNLDNTNILALAYFAEILIDQQRITQAEQNISKALDLGQNLMDVHRVYAYLLETQGLYSLAIEEYKRGAEITPNLTFLYMRAGANYRTLAFNSTIKEQRQALYDSSLEYFAKAAKINEQLGVKDPGPYLSISKTYSQLGEFYAAGRNVLKALEYEPTNPDVYGQLGIVFTRSRNFEGAIPALKCAIAGCTAAESCDARGGCGPTEVGVEVKGMELSPSSVVYYYSYVSNLAALSRPKSNKCPEARQVIAQIRAGGFGDDPIVKSILQENENICALVGSGIIVSSLTATPAPTSTTPQPKAPTSTPGY